MYVVTAEEMRAVDRYTIEKIGIPALVLMENAGRAAAEAVIRLVSDEVGIRCRAEGPPRWVVLVGKGNNGGDGLVCARHLAEHGYDVLLLYAENPDGWSGEPGVQRDIARRLGLREAIFGEAAIDWARWEGIVDALLGTGASGAPREPYASLIREASESGLPIVSVDLPSGLDADTGEAYDPCIRARLTVALAALKRGLMLRAGPEHAGKVAVCPIGIPDLAFRDLQINTFRLDKVSMSRCFGLSIPPKRAADTHKGTYGHVLVAAGSRSMSGAGQLCAKAALRAGAGLVTWAVPEALVYPLTGRLPEVMLRGIGDGGTGEWRHASPRDVAALAERKQALVVGPGMGRWPGDAAWLRELWETVDVPLVLDADALNMMAEADWTAWPRKESPVVLTPHPGEMARLCGMTAAEVQRDRIGLARQLAIRSGAAIVLKGNATVVATPDGSAYVNTTGNPGMATGGAGDVLAGIIGGLLAQGLSGAASAAGGVLWHGLAGDRAAATRHDPASLIAGDIIEAL